MPDIVLIIQERILTQIKVGELVKAIAEDIKEAGNWKMRQVYTLLILNIFKL